MAATSHQYGMFVVVTIADTFSGHASHTLTLYLDTLYATPIRFADELTLRRHYCIDGHDTPPDDSLAASHDARDEEPRREMPRHYEMLMPPHASHERHTPLRYADTPY